MDLQTLLVGGICVIAATIAALMAVTTTSVIVGFIGLIPIACMSLWFLRTALVEPHRICPRCGRRVKVGWVACGPCGYQFDSQPPTPALPAHPYWPPSPVPLQPPTTPTASASDQSPPPGSPAEMAALYRQRWPMRLPPAAASPPSAETICPRCGRPLGKDDLACAACGYTFVYQPPARPSQPPGPPDAAPAP
ncbi:MAG TPA: hypothetical protein VKT52_12675 [Ktedonobacterales bacterium]|nr:hypothetical protein [Ktedonobacterales bacterium]